MNSNWTNQNSRTRASLHLGCFSVHLGSTGGIFTLLCWRQLQQGWRSAAAHAMTGPLCSLRVAAMHWLGITFVLVIPHRGSSRKDVPQTLRQAQWTARWALPTVVPLCRWDRRALRAGPYTSLPGCPMQQAPRPQPPQHRPLYETSSLLPR